MEAIYEGRRFASIDSFQGSSLTVGDPTFLVSEEGGGWQRVEGGSHTIAWQARKPREIERQGTSGSPREASVVRSQRAIPKIEPILITFQSLTFKHNLRVILWGSGL